jgi:uncharacterized protein
MTSPLHIETISFRSGDRRLDGRAFSPDRVATRGPAVLFFHGLCSSQSGYYSRAVAVSRKLDAISLTFDLSGHGHDAGLCSRYSVYDHLEDAISAYDCLASHDGVDQARIGVCGASYGGYLAALLTARRTVKQLILRAPSLASDIEFPPQRRPPPGPAAPDGFGSLEMLEKYDGDVLIIESEKDTVIPRSHIEAYMRACSRPQHKMILEATHALTDPSWDREFVQHIITSFRHL